MANDTNNIWIDSSFYTPSSGDDDVRIDFSSGESDNFGSYSFPVIYMVNETTETSTNVGLEYYNQSTATSGNVDISSYYYITQLPYYDNIIDSLVACSFLDTAYSGSVDINNLYFTGYNVVSGTQEAYFSATIGLNMPASNSIYTWFQGNPGISGSLNYWNNYTNFSGNLGPGNIPIPFYSTARNINSIYRTGNGPTTSGNLNNIVDVTFAGWVNFPYIADIYSALGQLYTYSLCEATTISGNVAALYCDTYSTTQNVIDITYDLYSSLLDLASINYEATIRDGRLWRQYFDLFSSDINTKNLAAEIILYPLKITNFSLDIDEYTVASGFISVDVVDDTCPVSVSGTYMLLNGTEVPITFESIIDGYRLIYNPIDDFASIDGAVELVVHAESECGNWLEESFYLTVGILVEYENYKDVGLDFYYGNEILTRISVEDLATCPTLNSYAWEFRTRDLISRDLSANINGSSFDSSSKALAASIEPLSTAYFYGREFRLVLNCSDYNGNAMETFIRNYKIEEES